MSFLGRRIQFKDDLRWLVISLLIGLAIGLLFGYLSQNYSRSLTIAFSISLTIWLLNCLIHRLLLDKIKNASREKKLLVEIPTFLGTSVLGFVICMGVFSHVYRIPFFRGKILLQQFALLFIIYVIIAGFVYAVRFYQELKEKEAAEEKLKRLAAEIELKGLKSQMNPHFLFNSLNSINALVTQDPKQAREMIARLSDLLRLSLDRRNKMVISLKEELDFARLYLDIERIRFGDRMEFDEEVNPDLLSVDFPSMVLQPLLENAVKHGIAAKRGHGSIRLGVSRNDDRIECLISNSIPEGNGRRGKPPSSGTGLENIKHRLDLIYKDQHDFYAGKVGADRYEVRFNLPLRNDE